MGEEKKWKRQVKIIAPAESSRRADFISTGVSCPGSNRLPKDDTVLVKFQYSLPVPTSEEEAKDFYNLALQDLVRKGVAQLGYTIDDSFKAILFGTGENQADPLEVANDPDRFAEKLPEAQAALDAWRYDPETARGKGSGKKVAVTDMVTALVNGGQLPSEIDGRPTIEAITTQAELMAALARFAG